ncbi:MAG: PEP-CTERM sorting domain-containing protein [Candidatus Nealsonbacteria bacterium]|nr:PEP-CTERM sorting domain-containing protein [Candidatus Nealsonbacteria bacterium]
MLQLRLLLAVMVMLLGVPHLRAEVALTEAATDTLKIYLLVGQSNMEGQAYTYDSDNTNEWNVPTMEFLLSGTPAATNYLANMPFDFKNSLDANWLQPRDDVWGVHYNSRDGTLNNILPTNNQADIVTGIQPLMPGFGVHTIFGSTIGPELGMGHRLGDAMQSPVFLFKSDKGGTTLGNDWRPPTAVAARGGSIGVEYTNTINRFTEFLDTLDADLADDGTLNAYNNATGYEVAAVFWFQGWNEKFNDSPYTAAQLQAEYTDNLKDLIYSIRAADSRIPDDLGIIIGESSDQHAGLNASRIAAVTQLNAEIPNSAAYFDTADMKDTDWGNNDSGDPFSQRWGYHFHARAEDFLEIGWKATGAAIDNGFTGSEVIPEPSTVAILFTGLLAMALFGWRRRHSR